MNLVAQRSKRIATGILHLGWITIFLLQGAVLHAQTLTQELLKEPAEKLVLQARESGNIVRGAILFHQGNIACAKCHRPMAEQDRIGPDLSRLGKEVTDVSLIESILQPSKVIKKEFQTAVVEKISGLTATGMVVDQDENRVVLRDARDVNQLLTISRSEIDNISFSSKSIMPDGLADALKGKQQFLDLLRYVINVKEQGPVAGQIATSTKRRELSSEMQGLVLLQKYNCVACHAAPEQLATTMKLAAPNLKWSAKKLSPQHLVKFIADPSGVKHGTTMPNLMSHFDEPVRLQSATAIVNYLISADGNTYVEDSTAVDFAAAKRGQDVFHTVGCVACHAPRNDKAIEQQMAGSVPLGQLDSKYSISALTEFLENPHIARPVGRMPNMKLTHREAVDVAHYLLQAKHDAQSTDFVANAVMAKTGKALFRMMQCAKCHSGIADRTSANSAIRPAMASLNPTQGCLSSEPKIGLPRFDFSEADRTHIRAALTANAFDLSKQQQIDLTLTQLNCTACHQRDNLGGVASARSIHFQTTNQNLGEQGRIPPTLTGVGAKLKSKWMRDVLVNGRSIRPYMKTRMPQFGEKNVAQLIGLLQETDSLSETEFATFTKQKDARDFGLKLVGNQGLNCVACHTYKYKISDTMPAVDLTEMSERLHKDWFYQYMLAPQKFSPNTVMPSFWPNGKAIRSGLEGSPEYQVESLWQYLVDGRQARTPRGVIREPLEIKVTNEARMLRRRYPEMAKRGIGVGYPGGVNLAFDAEQLRLALIWKGRFIDPSGVWYGQGHGKVKPLGQTKSIGMGPELDDINHPWVVDDGRPPEHQFQGYTLDDQRRPTFQYSYKTVRAEDFFFPEASAKGGTISLRRRVHLKSATATDSIRFRLTDTDEVTAISEKEFRVKNGLRIRIISEHSGKVISSISGKQIIVPLQFDGSKDHELLVEYSWD